MKREDAIDAILCTAGDQDLIITTTGLISREVFERYDSDRNFYVPGSMGLVSSIGCGLALAHPGRRVIVIDGDASLLMNLGSLVTIGHRKPANLIHAVLDNSAYGSCSEESSMSATARLNRIARSVGYAYIRVATRPSQLVHAILDKNPGPGFILCRITLGGRRNFLRPMQLETIKRRFMEFIGPPEGEAS